MREFLFKNNKVYDKTKSPMYSVAVHYEDADTISAAVEQANLTKDAVNVCRKFLVLMAKPELIDDASLPIKAELEHVEAFAYAVVERAVAISGNKAVENPNG